MSGACPPVFLMRWIEIMLVSSFVLAANASAISPEAESSPDAGIAWPVGPTIDDSAFQPPQVIPSETDADGSMNTSVPDVHPDRAAPGILNGSALENPFMAANTAGTVAIGKSSNSPPTDEDTGWTTIWGATGSGTLTRFSYSTDTGYGQWYRLRVDGGPYIHWQANAQVTYYLQPDPVDYPPDNTNWPRGSISTTPADADVTYASSITIEGVTNRVGGAPTTYDAQTTSTPPPPPPPPPPPSGSATIAQSSPSPPTDDDAGWTTIWSATGSGTLSQYSYVTNTEYGQWYRIRVDEGPFIHWQANSATATYYLQPSPVDYPPDNDNWPRGSITTTQTSANIAYSSSITIEGTTNRPGGATVTFEAQTAETPPPPPPPPPSGTIAESQTSPPVDSDTGWTLLWSASGSGVLTRYGYSAGTTYGQWYRIRVDGGSFVHWQSNSDSATYYLQPSPVDYPPDNDNWPRGSISTSQVSANIAYSSSIIIEGTTNRPGGASLTIDVETGTSVPPYPPSNPSPADASTGVDHNSDLSWTGGGPNNDPIAYTVYLEAGDSTPDIIVCDRIASTSCDPGSLAIGTTYYWRVNACDPSACVIGSVWSFTTRQTNQAPYAPFVQSPGNGAIGTALNVVASWTGGDPDGDSVTYSVYSGLTSPPTDVECVTTSRYCDLGSLSYSTTYYWRVVSSDGAADTVGTVWSFRTRAAPDAEEAFADGFEEDSDEWTATGLWHRAVESESSYPNALRGVASTWFGDESTGTYETGGLGVRGDLVSPPISLAGVAMPMLHFASWYETEDTGEAWDTKSVYVSTNDGSSWSRVAQVSGTADFRQWADRYVGLSQYAGQTIRLKFEFGTLDALFNSYRGWYVDDVTVFDDADQDGLSFPEELRRGSDPYDSDTDDDGILDIIDVRPNVEDIAPWWESVGENDPIGRVTFYPDAGFVEVDMEPATDNVAVEGVAFVIEMGGTAGASSVKATVRIDLVVDEATGYHVGRFPLPKNFENGQATSEDIVLVVADVNGNQIAYVGSATETIQFNVPWVQESHPDFERLHSADIESATATMQTMRAREYAILPHPAPLPEPILSGIVAPDGTHSGATSQPLSPRETNGTFVDIPSVLHEIPNALLFVGEAQVDRASITSTCSFCSKVWVGVQWGWENAIIPTAQSFAWRSDRNGNLAGEILAGLVLYGDVRDVVIGYQEGDDVTMWLGVIGLAMTPTGPGDGFYTAAKPAIKKNPEIVVKPLLTGLKSAVDAAKSIPSKATELGRRITHLARYVDEDIGKANALAKFAKKFPEGDQVLLALKTADDTAAVEAAIVKYGDSIVDKYRAVGSKLTVDDFIAAAKAEKGLGGNIVDDVGELATVKGVEKVLSNVVKHSSTASKGTMGYVFELKQAAALKRSGSTIKEMNTAIKVDFWDAKGNWRTGVNYDVDAEEIVGGRTIFNEFKAVKKLSGDVGFKNQVLKMEHAVNENLAHEARVIVKTGIEITGPAKQFAKDHGIKIYDEMDLIAPLNP